MILNFSDQSWYLGTVFYLKYLLSTNYHINSLDIYYIYVQSKLFNDFLKKIVDFLIAFMYAVKIY